MAKAKIWTNNGIKILGELIYRERLNNGWSQRQLAQKLRKEAGWFVSDSSLCSLEKGAKMPTWNTIAAIAALEFIRSSPDNRPLTPEELSDIAAEVVNPFAPTGATELISLNQVQCDRLKILFLKSLKMKGLTFSQFIKENQGKEIDSFNPDAFLAMLINEANPHNNYYTGMFSHSILSLLRRVRSWEPLRLYETQSYARSLERLLVDLKTNYISVKEAPYTNNLP